MYYCGLSTFYPARSAFIILKFVIIVDIPAAQVLKLFNYFSGITMADGPQWREARAWVVRKLRVIGLGRRQMSDLMTEELNEILKTVKGGGVHRLKQIIGPAVINVLWTLATGKRFSDRQRCVIVISRYFY